MSNNVDTSVRVIVVHRDCYSKYCAKCPFCVKAEWSKNEGFKYHVLDVYCCMECGKKGVAPMCPEGIGYGTCLGEVETFDPSMFLIPYPILKPTPRLKWEKI